MAVELERLVVKIEADLRDLKRDMASAARVTQDGSKKMAGSLQSLSGAATLAKRALGSLGVAFGVRAIAGFVRGSLDAVGGLGELAQQLGVSTDALQVYQFAATQAGVSTGELQTALSFLTRTIGQAADGEKVAIDAFNRLGVGVLDAGGNVRSTEAVFRDVAEAIKNINDPSIQARSAVELFSRSGQRLIPILAGGAAGLSEFERQARAAGVVLNEQMIAQADEASDKMAALAFQVERLGQAFAVKLGPAITRALGNLEHSLLGDSLSEQIAKVRKNIEFIDQGAKNPFVSFFGGPDIGARTRRAQLQAELESLIELQRELSRGSALSGLPSSSGPTSNPLSTEDAAKASKGPFAANFTADMERRAQLAQLHAQAEQDSLAALEQFRQAQSAAILDLDTSLRLQTQEQELLLKFGGDESEEYRVQVELMRIKNDLGADAARNAEEEVRQLEKVRKQVEVMTEEQREAKEAAERSKETARDLGLTFTSAFEDAVIAGKGLREVLAGILQDIARIILRKGATEPAGDFLGGIFGDIFKGVLGGIGGGGGGGGFLTFGGPRASGGPVTPSNAFLVGEKGPELFVPRVPGTIVPSGGGGAAGGMVSAGSGGAQVFIDARGADVAAIQRLERGLAALDASVEQRSVSAMFRQRRTGGSVARAFGG